MKFNRCFGCMEEIPGYPCHNCGFDPTQTTAPNYVLPYGTILDGRYLVGNMLGRGGFGITYIGFDLMLQRKVAIKEYYPSGQVSRITTISTDLQWLDSEQPDQLREKGIRSCLREARKMAKIGDIPEVVRVLECFQENDTAYIVMDYVDGKTLMSVLREQGPMTWDQAKGIFLPAISAMEEVHQAGMVHRDISPDNLMLTKKGVRILDLGAAKDLGINNGASSELVVKGGFSPLEQYAHQGGSGPWTDVYAMAATMYHCLTGVIPPAAVDRSQEDTMDWALLKARGVPNYVITALQNAMKLTVRERTQSMAELLRQCRSNSTGRSKPKPVPEPEPSKTQPPVTEAPVHKIKKRNDSVFNHLRKNGNSKSIGFTIGFAIAFCAVVAVLVMLFMNGNVRKDPSQPTDYNPIGSKPVAENPWIENILMSDEAPEWIVYNGYDAFVMGSDIPRKQIQSITFLDTLKDAPTDSWDVSENGDGSVLAWVTNGSELFFGANGGINAKYCKGLFYGYYNVSEINFNHCFHTDFATNMASMFDFCPALSVLDVSDFNTANVTDMSGMFYDCSSLTRIDLSGFDTSKVTGMSCMFTNCCKITSLDLSSFDTSNVTSMSWMFYKCLTLSNLVIDGFCTTNVTDMGNMFFECPKLETINGIEGFDTRNVVNHDDFMESGKLVNGHRWEELFAGSENGNVDAISFSAGDIVSFGRYEQDNNRQNGSEPIEWLVLDVQNGKALLLSKYALDAKPYHDQYGSITWEDCSLRKWLNGDFLNTAFSEAEKNSVLTAEVDNSKSQGYYEWRTDGGNNTVDKVFLLSDAEAWFYFGSNADRRCMPTAYASAMGADFKTENGKQYATGWWLRSPGENEYSAEYVNFRGDHISNVVGNGYVSIRPAVWVSSADALKPQ